MAVAAKAVAEASASATSDMSSGARAHLITHVPTYSHVCPAALRPDALPPHGPTRGW